MVRSTCDEDELVAEAAEELPPSAKLVFKILEYEGPLTQQQIAKQSLLAQRTVRTALKHLKEMDLVEQDIYLLDARQSLYSLAQAASDPAPESSKHS